MKKIKFILCLIAASFLFAGCGESTKKKYCQKHDTFDENLCCVECGEDITSGYEYYVDYQDNIFCDKECVEKYYGIRSA